MARLALFLVLLATMVIPIPTAFAQEATGGIDGILRDSSGTAVDAAKVTVEGKALLGKRWTVSNATGYFQIQQLPVGSYTVAITKIGRQPVTFETVTVRLGRTTTLGSIRTEEAVLKLEPLSIKGEPPTIDPSRSSLGTVLSQRSIQDLPRDRSYQSLVSLAPTVSASPNDVMRSGAAGSTFEGTYYYIDGSDVTDPTGGGIGTQLPQEFTTSVDIKTGGFEAEYGRALGAIVNVVTPSGGNETHGSVFGYYTNQALVSRSENSLSQAPAGDFSSYDVGGNVGGPLLKDRLWWFLAYNPAWDRQDVSIPGLQPQPSNSVAHRAAGKLAWKASDRTDLNLTVVGDPGTKRYVGLPLGGSVDTVYNVDAVLADMDEGGSGISLQGHYRPSSRLHFNGIVARTHSRSSFIPATEVGRTEPHYQDLVNSTASGGAGGERRDHADRWAGHLDATYFGGAHSLKMGAEYQDNSGTSDAIDAGGTVYRIDVSTYLWVHSSSQGTVHVRAPSAFVQDSWRVTDRLRLNVGARWDANYYVDPTGALRLQVNDGFQPRLGATYLLDQAQSQKIHATYGLYYEQLPVISPGQAYFVPGYTVVASYDHDPRVDPSGGDTTAFFSSSPGVQSGIKGQYFAEYSLGYERALPRHLRVGLVGRYREIRSVVEDALSSSYGDFVIGNPGQGLLSEYPKASQSYRAIECTADRTDPEGRLDLHLSYVLSQNRGNYEGLDYGNSGPQFDFIETTEHSSGPLPSDRTHQFKLYGSHRFPIGLTLGSTFFWESGTPLSELGAIEGLFYNRFLTPRGSAGRTPSVWDWNLHFAYDLVPIRGMQPKLLVDLFHVFTQHRAIRYDEVHYLAVDSSGNQTSPNPNYLQPTLYQPEFSARLGVKATF